MSRLFDDAPLPGLAYRRELVDAAGERELVARIGALPFRKFQFHGWEGNRRTVSFGWHYDFAAARLSPAPPIPDFLLPLRARVAEFARVAPETFAHALVIEYAVGAGIGWHRDKPSFDLVAGVSLVAPCTMRFRRRRGAGDESGKGFDRVALPLEPRSAYVLTGPARHEWEHSIAPMEALRYSVTFRTLADRG